MSDLSQAEHIQSILRTELHTYKQAHSTVQFTFYGLPAFLLVAAVFYLFLWLLDRPRYEFHNMLYSGSYVLAGYLGYAWRAFKETTQRASAVSAARRLAESHGLKVIHWPGGKGITRETVEVVDADSNLGKPVNWSRNWQRWDCLADLT